MHALLAFDAAARHLSFSRAAEELHLTHGAISHALRGMEADLGTPLFRRKGNAMLLTDAGQALAVHVQEALARITQGLDEAQTTGMHAAARTVLTVSVLPAFAAHWLIPRLPGFYRVYPEIDIILRATSALADFKRDDVDVAIRYGPGRWPGLDAKKLLDEAIFPVCSPAFAKSHALHQPADLLDGVTLLRDLNQPWTDWFRLAGLGAIAEPVQGPAFSDAGLLLQAAAAGQGAALARDRLVRDQIAAGRLIRLFKGSIPAEYAYYVVRPTASVPTVGVIAFTTWIKRQIAADGQLSVGDASLAREPVEAADE